jgi:hypothetical protein
VDPWRVELSTWRVALAVAFALLVAWLALGLRRGWRALLLRLRVGRARRLEGRAARVLRRAGYRIVATQVTRELAVLVDDAPRTYVVRADALVEDRRGERFVVEVKSGARAPDPLHPPTRRQLLEYQLGYAGTAGVLLVDMERRRVIRVRFPAS